MQFVGKEVDYSANLTVIAVMSSKNVNTPAAGQDNIESNKCVRLYLTVHN